MPYRLLIQDTDPPRRAWLRAGENLIGSSESSFITLDHSTVSRNHAVLVVTDDGVQLADVGSVNGTYVDGAKLREITTVQDGTEIVLGSVSAALEFVASGDAEAAPAVAVETRKPTPPKPSTSRDNRTTTSSHPVQLFALRVLPELIDTLESSGTTTTLAQLFGKGILDLFPLEGLALSRSGVPYFTAGRDHHGAESDAAFKIERGAWSLYLSGPRAHSLALARPLFESALALIEMAESGSPCLASSQDDAAEQPTTAMPIVSLNPVMRALLMDAEKIAQGDVSILIQGESGTGKEVFARYVHDHSGREPLIALNCAALPQDLLEAELFGIESGVATGVNARAGCFERAHGGTLFLDEIADMSPAVQAKVLRTLETKEVVRLGGAKARPAEARILAATNKDLASMVESEEFRLDLYHRIADWDVRLPTLRDRVEDLPNLVSLFLQQESSARQIQVAGVSTDVLDIFLHYTWPGNIRELQREIKRSVLLLTNGDLLSSDVLSARVRDTKPTRGIGLEERLRVEESLELRRALVQHGGKASAAAEALQVPVSSFYRKLKAHGLTPPTEHENRN